MKPRINAAKSLALMASMLGAVAPAATVAPNGSGNQKIAQSRAQNQNASGMAQARAVRASQPIGITPGIPFSWRGPQTDFSTFPAWNQRKARRDARRTGRRVQKRYGR